MKDLLNVAVEAARAGGAVISAARVRRDFEVKTKSPADFVTEVDVASEEAIVALITASFPDHDILGEEGVAETRDSGSEWRWVIDPLDGTTNFIRDLPAYAVSISCEQHGKPVIAAVLDVVHDELFTATRGEGASCNGRPLKVSVRDRFEDGLWLTGIPFRNLEVMPRFLPGLKEMASGSCGIRRMGSAAIDLCAVAIGRAEGFWEWGLSRWDISAGILIVEEAGGKVSGFSEGGEPLDSGDIVASNGLLHEAMLTRLG